MRVLSLNFFSPLREQISKFPKAIFCRGHGRVHWCFKTCYKSQHNVVNSPCRKHGFSEKIVGFRFFGSPLFLPPQMLRWISIALGRTSKKPISDLPYLLQFWQNLQKILFWGFVTPPLAIPLTTSNFIPIETTPQALQSSGKSRKSYSGIFHKSTFCIWKPASLTPYIK